MDGIKVRTNQIMKLRSDLKDYANPSQFIVLVVLANDVKVTRVHPVLVILTKLIKWTQQLTLTARQAHRLVVVQKRNAHVTADVTGVQRKRHVRSEGHDLARLELAAVLLVETQSCQREVVLVQTEKTQHGKQRLGVTEPKLAFRMSTEKKTNYGVILYML